MRTTRNISITFPTAMAVEAERVAKRENRTMSDLMREAFRHYCADRSRVPDDEATILRIIAEAQQNPLSQEELEAENARLMAYGAAQAKKVGFRERDVVRVIHESRARRAAS